MAKLEKGLKLIDIFSISSGAMVSAGIFILPGIAYGKCGPSVIFAYFLAGLLSIPGVFSIAELVTAMPKAGGGYFFVTRSLGAGVGTVAGVLSWFSLIFKTTFALVGLSTYLILIISINPHIVGIVVCMIFLLINYFGVKKAGRIQVFLVFILFAILVFYIIFAFNHINVNFYVPFVKGNLQNIFSTAGFVFVSYGGLLKVASLAEEVEDSKKLPKGMLLAMGIICIIYTLLVFVTVGLIPGGKLATTITPISDGGAVILGSKGRLILSIAAVIGFVSAANVGIMSASRYPYALSKDSMFPEIFSVVSKKFKTPYLSILVTGILIILSLFLKLDILVEIASTSLILTYILANISVIIMRESKLVNYNPQFKAFFYPYLQIVGVIIYIFLIFEIGKEALFATLIFILASIIIYFFYGRKRKQKEFALLHVVERIINKKITGVKLEKELRKILLERDSIKEDRFDKLVKKSLTLDIPEKMDYKQLYKIVSKKLAKRINLTEKNIFQLLMEKEERFSSVLGNNLAIPHIVIDGEKIFDMVLIRAKEGIIFPEDKEVHVIFILIGTLDERYFHLQSLSAIAQIIHDKHFLERWMEGKDETILKHIVLLSKRERITS
jgi:amino acid transporter/mannitol/fructose-specific phosphotransferase system IIA component (Ntr-type)